MDELTHRYYSASAPELVEQYDGSDGGVDRYFQLAYAEGMHVLDIGAGSGRDMNRLLEIGCDVCGVEPCDELRLLAQNRYPQLKGKLESGELPNLGQPFGKRFDGVLCSAVLMHVPSEQIFDAAFSIRNVLKPGGRLLLSIPLDRPGLDVTHRDKNGRLFTPLQMDRIQLLFERLGFQLIGKWTSDDSLHREGYSWMVLLFHLLYGGTLRPLDQIEGILNRDRKVATYKLALFRALSEIAITEFEQARWLKDSRVAIPVDVVCEKWLYYYWPLFESARFIPQIRGEAQDGQHPIAFRESLSRLIELYAGTGGLSRFIVEYRGRTLPKEAWSLLTTAMARIRNTIVVGPVTYAGGSLETGRIFKYDGRTREILMDAAIWRELSLLGHWIQDAVVLRWAELTADISKRQMKASEIVDLLLIVPTGERNVSDARDIFGHLTLKACAWTGRPISRNFEVDHIIPFSLWHNNDLWNLVPVLSSVNRAKSDRLPTRELLLGRKDCIIDYWELMHSTRTHRFQHEVCRIIGEKVMPANWQRVAFNCVAEAVEITATQRGCERWEPK